ncbi:MAG: serine/threonine-protein kinase [Marinicella sp.]
MNEHDKDKLLQALKSLTGELSTEQEHELFNESNLEKINLLNKVKQQFNHCPERSLNPNSKSPQAHWGGLQIKDKIASGGMGEVYLAFDPVLNRDVAVKFLSSQSSQYISPESFIEEARRVAKIRHSHIMAIFGAQIDQNVAGFWSELLSGKTLAEFEIQSLGYDEKLNLALQLAHAVNAIHKNHVVHADIKPQNVMIEPGRGAVLMDFGAGHDLKEQSNRMVTAYTPLAMAPELFHDKKATSASDVYALGVVYYYIFNDGTYPYNPASMTELKELLQQPIRKLSFNKLPAILKGLIMQMLSSNPNKRPAAQHIKNQLIELKQRPLKRMKRIAIASIFTMLSVVLALSLINYHQLKKEQERTNLSLKETSEINALMYDLLSTVSPSREGKDVLMINVLNELIANTKEAQNINDTTKGRALATLAISQFNLGFQSQGLELIDQVLSNDLISTELRAHILLRKGQLLQQYVEITHQQRLEEIEHIVSTVKNLIEFGNGFDAQLTAELAYLNALIEQWDNDLDGAKQSLLEALSYWQQKEENKSNGLQQFKMTNQLGNLHASNGQYYEASQYYQSALALAEKYAENDVNVSIIEARTNLAATLAQAGQPEKSLAVLDTLQKESGRYFGEEHPKHLIITINFISNLNQLEAFQQALEIETQYLPVFESIENTNSEFYLYFQSALAITKVGLGQSGEAAEIYLNIIDKASRHMGEYHVFTLSTVFNLAELYNKQNQPEEAKTLLDKYLGMSEEKLGAKHQVTLEMLEAKAWALYLSDELSEAVKTIQYVIELKNQVYGPDNSFTLQAKEKLKAMEKKVQEQD